MKNNLIEVFTGEINNQKANLVDARTLHAFLEVATQFRVWINRRIEEYEFAENIDFIAIDQKRSLGHGRGSKEYHLTLDMAKELSMVERTEKGREARRYFIECEKQMHSNKVSFDQEYFSAMDKALKFYRDSIFDLKEYEIVGKITRLFRDPESDEGKVTIQAHIEEKSKNIELSLSAEDYDVAIKMHEARGNVVCIGDIQVRKRSAVMTRVISFREIPQTRVDIKE